MNKIYDCNLCMHNEVCDLWARKIANSDPKTKPDDGDDFVSCSSVSYGCRHFDSKRRYICISDVKGTGPDSPGPDSTLQVTLSFFASLSKAGDVVISVQE